MLNSTKTQELSVASKAIIESIKDKALTLIGRSYSESDKLLGESFVKALEERKHFKIPAYPYLTEGEFVCHYGKAYSLRTMSKKFSDSEKLKKAFHYSNTKLAQKFPKELTYVEGFVVVRKKRSLLIETDCWCIDNDTEFSDGRIVDISPTHENEQRITYYGVPFKHEYCNRIWAIQGCEDYNLFLKNKYGATPLLVGYHSPDQFLAPSPSTKTK